MRVYLEEGQRRVFACALDWPGWCRAAKTGDLALEALAAYAPRYGAVARETGIRFPSSAPTFEVVERLPGSATTDFGAPGTVASADHEPLKGADLRRHVAILEASWAALDRVVASAPAELRKGPRGGGRDRDKIAEHVNDAEVAYARTIGVATRGLDRDQVRAAILDALRRGSLPEGAKRWPLRYAARRVAWHVLDHAWEIEDRSVTTPA